MTLITGLDLLAMDAVLATKPTQEAVAVAYAICISQGRSGQGPAFWSPLHTRICDALWPCEMPLVRLRKLDKVKKRAWQIYDAMVGKLKESK